MPTVLFGDWIFSYAKWIMLVLAATLSGSMSIISCQPESAHTNTSTAPPVGSFNVQIQFSEVWSELLWGLGKTWAVGLDHMADGKVASLG